jgi:hypothetical protein
VRNSEPPAADAAGFFQGDISPPLMTVTLFSLSLCRGGASPEKTAKNDELIVVKKQVFY